MRSLRKQFTLASLMIVVAVVAVVLAIPRSTWVAMLSAIPSAVSMSLLAFAGFGGAVGFCKLLKTAGLNISQATRTRRQDQDLSGQTPCLPR